ncbi:hypothetical protein ACFFVB_07005 [Formosa undariae]|uniref:Acetyltransferase n=1 Tax=Formosa undariae TaxID=1325436 RepID=A0ABV5F082_9FLAO
MRNVIILGTGGCASEVTFLIEDINSQLEKEEQINIRGYIDYADHLEDNYNKYTFEAPVLCDIDDYIPKADEEVLIAVMSLKFKAQMIEALKAKKANIGSLIHHSVVMPKDLDIGEGNIVFPFCILEKYSKLGSYNLLMAYSFISHDCVVGDCNFLSVAGIAGAAKVGNYNYFALRSMVLPGVEIGNNNVIQAGMIVDRSIQDDTTIFYRFKEKVMAIPKV